MNLIEAIEVTTLESLFQVAYEATIQAEQQRHDWNGRKFAEQADAAWEDFHNACDRFRRQYRTHCAVSDLSPYPTDLENTQSSLLIGTRVGG